MKILVTGGLGYIGSVLVPKLINAGHKVTIVDINTYSQIVPIGAQTYLKMPVSEYLRYGNNLVGFDAVYHLAALVGAPLCEKKKIEAIDTNLVDTVSLVNALNDQASLYPDEVKPVLIYPNTNSGYGSTGEAVCTEETPLNSISLYGMTKDLSERYIREAYDNFTIFRLATVFGLSPRMRYDLLVNNMLYESYFNDVITLFDGNYRRNFVHIEDVAYCMLDILNNAAYKNEVFNLGNDNLNMTKLELALEIANITGAKIKKDLRTDPDKRDYNVSSKKLLKTTGYAAKRYIANTVKDIFMHLQDVGEENASLMRNA